VARIKIFVREPLGVIGTVGVPVLIFVVFGRLLGPQLRQAPPQVPRVVSVDLPILASLLIATSTMLSLVAIIAIYRDGGILRRPEGHASAAAHHPHGACHGQAAVHGAHACGNAPRGPALLSRGR